MPIDSRQGRRVDACPGGSVAGWDLGTDHEGFPPTPVIAGKPDHGHLGLRLPDKWQRMGVPKVPAFGDVPAYWLAANQASFRHEPEFQTAYHRGESLVRLSLEDVEGEGTIEYWDSAERKHRELDGRVSLLAQPATLTWRWNTQGGRT